MPEAQVAALVMVETRLAVPAAVDPTILPELFPMAEMEALGGSGTARMVLAAAVVVVVTVMAVPPGVYMAAAVAVVRPVLATAELASSPSPIGPAGM